MDAHHRTPAQVVLVAVIAAFLLEGTALPRAQRRRADNSAQGVPVATNTIARDPAPYFDKVVKIIGPTFTALRNAAQESKADGVARGTSELAPAFAATQPVWSRLALTPAAGWTREAASYLAAIERRAAAGEWDAVRTESAAPGQLCQNCHGAYRERQDDGSFLLKLPTR